MKVGILTFHYSCNYGGVLQAYALQEYVKTLGHEVKIINFVPKSFRNNWKSYIPRTIDLKVVLSRLVQLRYGNRILKAFDKFREEYFSLTQVISDEELPLMNDKFDAIIVGSDQVWNPSQHPYKVYFLNWEPAFTGRKIAYAPCCGINQVRPENKERLCKALRAFHSISARNPETANFVEGLMGKAPEIVPDPTLLSPIENLAYQPSYIDAVIKSYGDYILVYYLGKEIDGGNKRALEVLKKKYPGAKIVMVQSPHSNAKIAPWADEMVYTASPIEWLKLIKNAVCVYTDSFHASIFAMKFQRDFIAYYAEKNRASRFLDMKTRYGVENNIINSIAELESRVNSDISIPSDIKKVFEKERKIGAEFLQKSFE
ncbi:MAG: polysaccharide pyruvyl transferase family protein [Bacteroidales bacterium]|nr:polysaccharide pyruvyl transferase family protein [Bacteroidales bacterium]